jgi:hypothetical protein
LLELLTDERLDLDPDDPRRAILLAVSDNGAPMTAHDTRAFMALRDGAFACRRHRSPRTARYSCGAATAWPRRGVGQVRAGRARSGECAGDAGDWGELGPYLLQDA